MNLQPTNLTNQMKLTKVSARNLKGLSFSLELAPISFLVGSNFAGKTARTDAIRLLLLGYLPELGKLASATFGLCSGRELVVEGEFSDGTKMTRRWFLKGDAVKSEFSTSGPGGGVITELIHSESDKFAVMLNAETYFALSERGRVDYVFANIPNLGAEAQPPAILATVEDVLRTDEDLDADAVKRFADALAAAQRDLESEPKPNEGDWTPQSFLDFALEFSTEEAKRSKVAAVTLEKTAQGLAYLRAAEVVDADLPALDAERDRLARELEPLQTARARVVAAAEIARANRSRREKIAGELRAKPSFENQRVTYADAIAKLKEARDALPDVSAELVDALRTEERDSANAESDHSRQLAEVVAAIARNERELAEVGSKTICPYCGAVGDGWKAIKTAEIESALSGLRTKRAQLEEHVGVLRNHATTVLGRFNNARTARQLRDGKEREIASAQQSLDAVEKNLAILAGKEDELSRIPAEEPNAIKALDDAQTAINVKNAELFSVETKRKAAMGRAHDLKRLAEAEKGRDDARKDEAVAKAAAKAFREQQSEIVEAAFGPLLATANSICGDVLQTSLAYRDGEIGTWRGGVWVGHKTFSGTEKALAYAAIQAALSALCPVRVVIIDELGRLDAQNAEKLVRSIARSVEAGTVDQFVGIDTGRSEIYGSSGEMNGVALTVVPIG